MTSEESTMVEEMGCKGSGTTRDLCKNRWYIMLNMEGATISDKKRANLQT